MSLTTTLINGDCLEVMKDFLPSSIDCIICDLPYGITKNPNDVILPFDKLWAQYERIIKPNGVILLFGQGLFFIDLVNSNRKLFRYDLVWNKELKTGFLNAKRMPLRQHEQIGVFYKKRPTYNPQMTKGKPLNSQGVSYQTKTPVNNNYGKFHSMPDVRKGCTDKYPTSILTFKKSHPSIAQHPTEKPVELLKYLVKTYTNEGDLVLANCMGSGSTGIACKLLNRSFIGIELNETYFNKAKNRLENVVN